MANKFGRQFISSSGLLGNLLLRLTSCTIPSITYAYFDSPKTSSFIYSFKILTIMEVAVTVAGANWGDRGTLLVGRKIKIKWLNTIFKVVSLEKCL